MLRAPGALLAIVILTVAGCAPVAVPAEPGSTTTVPSPTGAATAPPVVPVFQLPARCADILPPERLAAFAADGLTLLGGPGGTYGDASLADRTPEQRAGGITCIWGDAGTTFSAITISVAPLTGTTRPEVTASLTAQGLNEIVDGPVTTFSILGDEEHRPAILNVLRPDSWLSVIMTVGGSAPFTFALDLADEVAAEVYR